VLEKIEARLAEIEACPDPVLREAARDLVRDLLEFHRAGLARLIELTNAGERLATDAQLAPLLLLHGLHPSDLASRVEQALEKVRPYLGSHGGSVELVGVEGGRVRLRLQGSCHGCPSSAETLRGAIEESILASAPDAEGIEVV
jgi:Fe-S cluster biogenesis protein NfuA